MAYDHFSHKMKEATLFILKQVLDEFGTTDHIMELDAAGMFLEQIRGTMQDRKSKPFSFVPFVQLFW